jgi:Outer membrane cytochrome MtrC/MtrF-like, domains II/IV
MRVAMATAGKSGWVRALIVAATAAGLIGGCGGSDGASGKQGKNGDGGPQGVPGEAGPPGVPGDAGEAGPPGLPGEGGPGTDAGPGAGTVPSRTLGAYDDLPGLVVTITGVGGGSGSGGAFKAGDSISVTFTIKTNAGADLPLSETDGNGLWFSGPTSNYQHVLPADKDTPYYEDANTAAAQNTDGSYTYTFPDPIPTQYGPPLMDTTKFSVGELAGQNLLDGTYTIAVRLFRNYTRNGAIVVDPGADAKDVLFGVATTLEPREVVKVDNCIQCHSSNTAWHNGTMHDTRLCVTCHTSGAEDDGSTDTGDPTNVTIDSRVFFHRIHNGEHLPSVNGVATNADGTRNYAATAVPFLVQDGSDFGDFSDVGFPAFPNLAIPMPRDQGYSNLTSAEKDTENTIREGVTDCPKCHGDPDGSGSLTAPAQGDHFNTAPSRRACGSCHDDVDFTKPYTSNGMTMPAQTDDTGCAVCHPASGATLAIKDAHLHPIKNPALNPGLNINVTTFTEAGTNDGNGKIDPGEKISVTFTLKDDSGADVAASSLVPICTDCASPTPTGAIYVAISGPTNNRNFILYSTIPAAGLAAGTSYTTNLPQPVFIERVGQAADNGSVETFGTSLKPHWDVTGGLTAVYERTATPGPSTTLAAAVPEGRLFLDLASATGLAANDYVVVDDGGAAEEYSRIRTVSGNRIFLQSATPWPSSAAPSMYSYGYGASTRSAHSAGASVKKVTLTQRTAGTDFVVDATNGTVTEAAAASFTAGDAILVSYTTDFVMPAKYPPAPYDYSPTMDESWGKWAGKDIAPGTYTANIWAYRVFTVNTTWTAGDRTDYRGASPPANTNFLVGTADTIVPYDKISSGNNCERCHDGLMWHGGSRRGFDTCAICHGSAGAQATPDVTVNFRTMLHKIHMGSSLPDAETYNVNGENWADVEFPAMPGGVKNCTMCHGTATAWQAPDPRNHPTQQGSPTEAWGIACGACHDSSAATAHISAMTYAGQESCPVCHDSSSQFPVEVMHKTR